MTLNQMITSNHNEYLRVTNCRDNENGWLNQVSFTLKFLITSNFTTEPSTQQSQTTSKQSK